MQKIILETSQTSYLLDVSQSDMQSRLTNSDNFGPEIQKNGRFQRLTNSLQELTQNVVEKSLHRNCCSTTRLF